MFPCPRITLGGVSYIRRSARPRAGHFFIRSQPKLLFQLRVCSKQRHDVSEGLGTVAKARSALDLVQVGDHRLWNFNCNRHDAGGSGLSSYPAVNIALDNA